MNEKIINSLTIDNYFGIYTRNGLEYILSDRKGSIKIFLVDFNNIKELNSKFGYKSVNQIFKNSFLEIKEEFIIGRAFSGDEVFICTNNLDANIDYIKDHFNKFNLKFKYVEGIFTINNDIENILEKLIEKTHIWN